MNIKKLIKEEITNLNTPRKYYHGTGETQKVIEALKNNTFIFHKSGGVENGIYLTPNKNVAIEYANMTTGNDKGVIKVALTKEPNIKLYKDAAELYHDEMSYSSNTKDSILKYRENMLSKGYDGIQTSDDVILIFKEKINIVKPLE